MRSSNVPRFGKRSSRGHVRRTKRSLPVWMVAVAAIVAIVAIGLIINILFFNDEETVQTSYANRTWLADSWTISEVTDQQIDALVSRLKENKIDTIYVETGSWRQDGTYREHPAAESFRQKMRQAAPNVKVLIWVWVTNDLYGNSDIQTSLVNYTQTALSTWNYDGIHLQGFSVFDSSENYVRLVRQLDEVTTASETMLSITVPPDRRPADPDVPIGEGNPSTSWTPRYKQQLGLIVDEMVIMPFPSGLDDADDYETWVAYQVEVYAKDIKNVTDSVSLVVALPNYPADELHDPLVENVEHAIQGTQKGIDRAGSARDMVGGVGMYVYEDATTRDWVLFRDAWAK